MPVIQHFDLYGGVKMPSIGFGTFSTDPNTKETYNAVLHALRSGYRHLDCAWFYKNEAEVGSAIHDFLDENSSVKREDLFICTKLWNHLHEPEDVKWAIEDSLKSLGLEYVDLYLIHFPLAVERTADYQPKMGADGRYVVKEGLTSNPEPTWRAMESLFERGKARSIGVSNWTISGLKQLLSLARIRPSVNQIEVHPFLANDELIRFCHDNNIVPVAYSPLGSQGQVPNEGETVRSNSTLNGIADRTGYSIAQILLAWALSRGYAVLPKSSTPSRIKSNLDIPDLPDTEIAAINAVAKGRHSRFVNMKGLFGYDIWPEESNSDTVSY